MVSRPGFEPEIFALKVRNVNRSTTGIFGCRKRIRTSDVHYCHWVMSPATSTTCIFCDVFKLARIERIELSSLGLEATILPLN